MYHSSTKLKLTAKRHSKADISEKALISGLNMKLQKLSDTFDGFERTVRAFSFSDNSGVSNSKQCDMSNGV